MVMQIKRHIITVKIVEKRLTENLNTVQYVLQNIDEK